MGSRGRALPSVLAAGLTLVGLATAKQLILINTAVPAKDLGGEERYLAHLSTDKPIYKEGEEVRVRGVLLHAHTKAPFPRGANAQIEVRGPVGNKVASGHAGIQDGVLAFTWKVPEGQGGGRYRIVAKFPHIGLPEAERGFEVRAYRPPRLETEITFLRDGYGPGDEVVATLEVTRAEGGIPVGAKVDAMARLDGKVVFRGGAGPVDENGRAGVRFRLPKDIAEGLGTLALTVRDGGVVETATKSLPILLASVDVDVYPEGGELVAGLANRVYLEARLPSGKPADLRGRLEDETGRVVAEVATQHEGRGRVRFTPAAGRSYKLRVTEPSGVDEPILFPAVRESGVVIQTTQDSFGPQEAVKIRVGTTTKRWMKITLSQRERELGSKTLTLRAGRTVPLTFSPEEVGGGVLRVTVWDDDGAPVAERLLFRRQPENLRVTVKASKSSYVPGDEVVLTVTTRDGDGEPVAARVGLTVSDDATRQMLEDRDLPPDLATQALLEAEVRELKDAAAYLGDDAEGPRRIDLLLGTQGWRRFAFGPSLGDFRQRHGAAAARVLAFRNPRPIPRPTMLRAFGGAAPGGMRELAKARRGPRPQAAPMPDAGVALEAVAAPVDELARDPVRQPANKPAAAPPPPPPPRRARLENRQDVGLLLAEEKEQNFADMDVAGDMWVGRKRRASPFGWQRVYAHKRTAPPVPGERRDFTETLYWAADLRTDAKTGRAEVRFQLSDSVTSFAVLADAFTKAGALASLRTEIEAVEPFYLSAKLPLEVSAGDRIRLPVAAVNGTDIALGTVDLKTESSANLKFGTAKGPRLGAGARVRTLMDLVVGAVAGVEKLTFSGRAGRHQDRVLKTLKVAPRGFPQLESLGGMLEPGSSGDLELIIPADIRPGSLQTQAEVFATPLGQLTASLERLIREPSGCFEQTSSTTYPLVMAQQYFTTHTDVDPELIRKSRDKLGKGYERLTGYECKSGGYEWFGQDPGHEALTAYGLMEFHDMGQVFSVDKAMTQRTRKWLLGTRDGKGGFKRERRALHTWIGDPVTSNAYILWALLEAGAEGLSREVEALAKASRASKDSYVQALAAVVMDLAARDEDAAYLRKQVARSLTKEGWVDGAKTSIVGSRGDSLKIETTALAVLGWVRAGDHAAEVEAGMRYLVGVCEGGRYGSTQSTVLALKAILAYDASRARAKAPGKLRLFVDGQPVGKALAFGPETEGAMALPDFTQYLPAGKHVVKLAMEDGAPMPFAITVRYHSLQPPTSPKAPVTLRVDLATPSVREGEVTEVVATVKNVTQEEVPNPIAIVGLPGGLEPRHEQLKELVGAGTIAAYEVRGREVILYWRVLKPGQAVRVPLAAVAEIPGTFTGPASRAYAYYQDEDKAWVEAVKVDIRPR